LVQEGFVLRILLSNPRGFCAGVHMAIDVVDQLLDLCPDDPIYVYHDIVHNKHVVDRFVDRGVTFVEDVAEVPEGSYVVFSAHGVSPAVRSEADAKGLTSIDATCPLVTKVHMEAIRYAKQGYAILLVGHANHQEVIGTRGEAPEAIRVVESAEDVWKVEVPDEKKVVYLTQTTLSTDDAEVIISEIRKRFPEVKEPPSSDICYATTNRQRAVREIAPDADLCLVIGSKHSSNSVRLTEIAGNVGTRARRGGGRCGAMRGGRRAGGGMAGGAELGLVGGAKPSAGAVRRAEISENVWRGARRGDDVSGLREGWFEGVEGVLVTAGASAPEDLVAELCRELVTRYGATIELRDIFREEVDFGIPATLKRVMREKGVDPAGRKISLAPPEVTEALYGTVHLTVGGV